MPKKLDPKILREPVGEGGHLSVESSISQEFTIREGHAPKITKIWAKTVAVFGQSIVEGETLLEVLHKVGEKALNVAVVTHGATKIAAGIPSPPKPPTLKDVIKKIMGYLNDPQIDCDHARVMAMLKERHPDRFINDEGLPKVNVSLEILTREEADQLLAWLPTQTLVP